MGDAALPKPGFHIGLAMAGAVSAGAYTAGVLDFMIEALSEWQNAKDRGEDVPQHEVFISTISGTSAGGIAAALGLASIAGGVRPVEEPSVNPRQTLQIRRVLPELYDVWVKKTKLYEDHAKAATATDPVGYQSLLDTGDLKPRVLPPSLLNSEMLTRTARATLSSITPREGSFPFFTDTVHLFLTRTNLDGIPYPIEFEGDVYWMNMHEDRGHFAVRGLGTRPFPQECGWLTQWQDEGDEIDFAGLSKLHAAPADQPFDEAPFETLVQCALTTSAFPLGLRAREIVADGSRLRYRALPFDAGRFPESLQRAQASKALKGNSHFVCVDGGALNNEPFELVRWSIRDLSEQQNARDPIKANRAVILIAPFPPHAVSDAKKLAKIRAESDLTIPSVLLALLPALINQARFKASDLIAASDPDVYSRFLVAPKRQKPQPASPDQEVPDLACALLYAFGGFIDEQFREHDFQLGRRNCQQFLRKHFTLHPENPVFGLQGKGVAAGDQLMIIPLVGTANEEVKAPEWPKFPEEKLNEMRAAIERRLNPVFSNTVAAFPMLRSTPTLRFFARLSWWWQRRKIVDTIMNTIKTALVDNVQFQAREQQSFWARLTGRK
jgi:hypothetical protein